MADDKTKIDLSKLKVDSSGKITIQNKELAGKIKAAMATGKAPDSGDLVDINFGCGKV